jgi:hypothetical protein
MAEYNPKLYLHKILDYHDSHQYYQYIHIIYQQSSNINEQYNKTNGGCSIGIQSGTNIWKKIMKSFVSDL